jgi:hypothetical protein
MASFSVLRRGPSLVEIDFNLLDFGDFGDFGDVLDASSASMPLPSLPPVTIETDLLKLCKKLVIALQCCWPQLQNQKSRWKIWTLMT